MSDLHLQVNDLFCYRDVGFTLGRGSVTLVSGPNSSGKTSLARILGVLASHEADPLHLGAAGRKAYVRDGVPEGFASLSDGTRTVKWIPGSGVERPRSQAPLSVPHAVGLVDFVRVRKDRTEPYEDLFLPDDPEAILKPKWDLPANQLAAVLKDIEEGNWDQAEKVYEGRRREAKRRWENLTGERYGEQKAAEWLPVNWTHDLEGLAREDLEGALASAQDALNALTVQIAVSQERVDRAKAILAHDLPAAEAEKRKAAEQCQEAREAADEARAASKRLHDQLAKALDGRTKAINIVSAKPAHHCPKCKVGLDITNPTATHGGETIVQWKAPEEDLIERANKYLAAVGSEESIEAIKDAINAAAVNEKATAERFRQSQSEVARTEGQFQQLTQVARDADAATEDPDHEAKRSQASNAVDQARRDLNAWEKRQEAKSAHDHVVILDRVCKLLSPSGARAGFMDEQMEGFRQWMKEGCARAGWAEIAVTRDYRLTSGGRPIQLCAANEQAKAQWLLSIVSAVATGSEVIVLDAVDLLRGEHWEGLVRLVNRVVEVVPDLVVVVCATAETDLPKVEGWRTCLLEAQAA